MNNTHFGTLLVLGMIMISALSCSSKKETYVEKSVAMRILEADTMAVPIFKDTLINNYVQAYDSYFQEYLTAIGSNDNSKIKTLQKQSLELIEKAKEVSIRLTSKADLEKFNRWLSIQDNKIKRIDNSK